MAICFQLEDVYNSIIDRVGRGTPIIVMPYPMGMTPVGCDASPLTEAEHEFLFEYAEVLNDLARTKAERVGIHFFEPGMGAFNDSRVCEVATSEAAINVVDLNPTEGSLVDRLAPVNWTHGSAHPNATGHVLTAKALTPWLRDLLTEIRTGTQPPNPEPNPDAQFELTRRRQSDPR